MEPTMGYKSIATFLSSQVDAELTLPAAIAVAQTCDGHLSANLLGVDMTPAGGFYMGASTLVLQETLDRARSDAQALEAAARQRLGRETLRWATDAALVQFAGLSAMVGLRARFADIVVQSAPYGRHANPVQEAVVEAALFEGQAPVLVVPESGLKPDYAKRIIVAWNQSNEALSAVRRALPLLKRADDVSIVIVNPPVHSPERSDPGGLLCQMLARHGVRAEVAVLAKTLPRVSDVLLRHASDVDAGLIVMGAYGHSRLREAILGGATRNMLQNAEVPVFLAH
jgi:nucleotide-binding universal stress UspA family protein